MGRVAGIRTGFQHLRRPVYLGVGRSGMGPGHPAVAVMGAQPPSGSGGKWVGAGSPWRWLAWGAMPHPGVGASGRAPGHGGVSFQVVGRAGGRGGAGEMPGSRPGLRAAAVFFVGWLSGPAVAAGQPRVRRYAGVLGDGVVGTVRASRAYGDITIYRSPASVFAVFGAPTTVIPACAGIRRRTSPATVMERRQA